MEKLNLHAKLSGIKFAAFVALFVLVFDILTKYIIRLSSPNIILLPFFSISFVENSGAAFGLFKGHNWLFILITVIVLAALVYYALSSNVMGESRLFAFSIALVVAGGLGNLVDRIMFGKVTDFIAFSFWPTFNIADSAITVGAMLLAISLYKSHD